MTSKSKDMMVLSDGTLGNSCEREILTEWRSSSVIVRFKLIILCQQISLRLKVNIGMKKHHMPVFKLPAGFKLAGSTIGGYLRDRKLLSTPSTETNNSVGSFIAIGEVFPSTWNWYQFLNIIALLSIMLAVMNLIPIPGLDGGHILFVLYEMISGRKPSDRFLMVAQMIGMVLLFALMFLAVGNDIGRLLR